MTSPERHSERLAGLLTFALILGGVPAAAREKGKTPQFKYVGGTENFPKSCAGTLELGSSALTFRCEPGSLAIPYSAITIMQYRPDVSDRVRKMKLKWKVRPPSGGGSRNRYFALLYDQDHITHAIVFEVLPEAMRPYLAELDLKSGKRVEVRSSESYD